MTLCRRRPVSSLMSTSLVWQRGRATELFQTGIGLGWYWYPPSISNDGGQTHREIREEQTNKQKNSGTPLNWCHKVHTLSSCDLITWLQGSLRSTSHHLEVLEQKVWNSSDIVMCAYKKYKRQTYYNKKGKKKTFIKDLKLFWCCYKETRIYSTRGQHRLQTTARCRTDIRAVDQNLETDIL